MGASAGIPKPADKRPMTTPKSKLSLTMSTKF